ncbi:MAG: hypothetical protein D6772_07735 [Bacteroidetes bacterium]|nr:MAG: hypothetical protein D6772_07735 [Bacteroidota bacterium]
MQTEIYDLIQARMKRALALKRMIEGRTLWVAISFFLFCANGFSQGGWEVIFGGNREDLGVAVLSTVDHGFIQVGYSESFGSDGDIDIYVARTDVDGTLLWQREYDEGLTEQPGDIIQMPDGSFMIVGHANVVDGNPGGSRDQVYLLHIDAQGEFLQSWRYANDGLNQRGRKIARTDDGGFIIIGSTSEAELSKTDVLVLRLDSNGQEVWRQTYGNTGTTESGADILEVPGGFLFMANGDFSSSNPSDDVGIYKIDQDGEVISVTFFGNENEFEAIQDFTRTSDGKVVGVGTAQNFRSALFLKCNLDGEVLWTRTLDITAGDDQLRGIVETPQGKLTAVGYATPEESVAINVILAQLNADGSLDWQRVLGQEFVSNRFAESIALAKDGGFIIGGFSAEEEAVIINDVIFIRVDENGNYFTNLIEGKVFWSQDGCNPYEVGDPHLANWLVTVSGDTRTYIGSTDEDGNYAIPVSEGSYTVALLPRSDAWQVCSPQSFPVEFTTGYDTLVYNFPVRAPGSGCPLLQVEISTGALTACNTATYTVNYCNDGSATAEAAYIDIILDPALTFVSSSVAPDQVIDSLYRYELGDLAALECGSFTLDVETPCAGAVDLQAITVGAFIYPATLCTDDNPNWNGASLELRGRCEAGQVIFTAKNVGTAPTPETQNYVIVEDVLMFLTGDIPVLDPDEEVQLGDPIPVDQMASTYRAIAQQTTGHPGNRFPTAVVEGCVQNEGDNYHTGFVTQFPEDDQDPYIDIDVQELLRTSGSANLLIGHPKGYLDSIIVPSTDIEYTVLFANTQEVDTLNRLVIRDTLPAELDLSSLVTGPASHPYFFELYSSGVLKITFDSLQLLPDGSGTGADSRGFVKFTLSQKPDLPQGTVIENTAAVYFDYVAPTRTNAVRHVIGCENFLIEGCITVDVDEPLPGSELSIGVYPNPFHTQATFSINGCESCGNFELIIRDALGREVRRESYSASPFRFEGKALTPALYFFELRSQGQTLHTGKLLVQ